MTFKEFDRKLKWNRAFDKYFFGLVGLGLISVFIYMSFFKEYTIQQLKVVHTASIMFITFGIYVLILAFKTDKFTIIKNKLTEEQNTEILKSAILEYSGAQMKSHHTIYIHRQKNIWKTPYEIRLYAGENFVAINVITNYRRGIVDFGKAARQRNLIIKLFKEQSASLNHKA